MSYEEKLVRFIASKLIQRKFFIKKHYYPTSTELSRLVERVIEDLLSEFNQLKLIRIKTNDGFIAPIIKKSVDKLII